MGIQVECPNGHIFKVKDKYAGKKGLCPHCEGQVIVVVPDAFSLLDETDELQKDAIRNRQAAAKHSSPALPRRAPAPCWTTRTTSAPRPAPAAACSAPRVIRHNIKCKCGERVPMWYARCPHCGDYLEH